MTTINELHSVAASAPTIENGKVTPPRRRKNADVRAREHLEPAEVEKLMAAARTSGRHGPRDVALVMLMYAHGLRVSEAVSLRWEQVRLDEQQIYVARRKNGKASTHRLEGRELRALRALKADSPYVFASERGGPMTASNVRKLITRLGAAADIGFPVHPHMLRHACGYKLVNSGLDTRLIQDYLGHRNIAHTVRYTQLAADRFEAVSIFGK